MILSNGLSCAISSCFPLRFQDVSSILEVPDNQVSVDPNHVGSIIFEPLDLKEEVRDNENAVLFLCDTASEQDAEETMVLEHSGNLELGGLHSGDAPTIATTAVGQMAISKGRQGRKAQNILHNSQLF
ncbi:uncharacterized protein LOC109712213 isoform X2 [Ananas comosus]|uniref:Uncharacterized protein LOC109712213 isoform X2 n=1 Tax=Ananas comosus TaxID=4615 RepID=A0A6P5FD58_ANACO|nr:uncharacterized protein LOC109712213 isoform X2 [Ananas comosus]XP_020091245.1 uncharacterized protein LOC109712213 isoform X2 [Ananas comosus]